MHWVQLGCLDCSQTVIFPTVIIIYCIQLPRNSRKKTAGSDCLRVPALQRKTCNIEPSELSFWNTAFQKQNFALCRLPYVYHWH